MAHNRSHFAASARQAAMLREVSAWLLTLKSLVDGSRWWNSSAAEQRE